MKAFVNNRQIFFMCLICTLGFGIFGIASICAQHLSTSGWILPIVCAVIFLIPSISLCCLAKNHKGDTLFDYAPALIGRLGNLFSFLYALFYLIFSSLMLSYLAHIVSLWILPYTSFRAILFFMVLICMYALFSDFTSVIRLVGFIGTLCAIASLLIRIAMITNGESANVFPLFDIEYVSEGLAPSVWEGIVFFFGMGILAVIPQSSLNSKSVLYVSLSLCVCAALMILIFYSCISMIGPLQTGLYKDAVVLAMKSFDISKVTFIQRADILFIIVWSFLILCAVCSAVYIPGLYVQRNFAFLPRISKLCLCAVIFSLSNIPSSMVQALYITNICCRFFGIFAVFIIPIILLAVSEVKKHEKN